MIFHIKGPYWKSLLLKKYIHIPFSEINVLYPLGIYTCLSIINNTHGNRKIALHFLCKAFFSRKR
jgi:hypothetical protein